MRTDAQLARPSHSMKHLKLLELQVGATTDDFRVPWLSSEGQLCSLIWRSVPLQQYPTGELAGEKVYRRLPSQPQGSQGLGISMVYRAWTTSCNWQRTAPMHGLFAHCLSISKQHLPMRKYLLLPLRGTQEARGERFERCRRLLLIQQAHPGMHMRQQLRSVRFEVRDGLCVVREALRTQHSARL